MEIPTGEQLLLLSIISTAVMVGVWTVVKWLFGPAETHEPTMRRGWQRPTGGGHWVNDSNGGGYQPYDGGSSCPSGLCTASRSNTLTAGEAQAHDASRRAWFEAEAFGEHASTGMTRAEIEQGNYDAYVASHPAPAYSAAPSLPASPTMTHHHTPAHTATAPANPEYVYTPLPAPAPANTSTGMAPQHRWSAPDLPPASEWGPPQLGDGSETVDGDWRWADSSHGDLVPINRK